MKPKSFQFLTALLERECGLTLDADKTYLAESRLAPVARQFGHPDIDALIANVMATRSRDSVREIVEAMVTNETFFFRDRRPFQHFNEVALPEALKARSDARELRIWCAATATGQEPYSLAMSLAGQEEKLRDWRITILGTDISEVALARARSGEYSQFEVQRGLPIRLVIKHFEQNGDRWRLKPDIRKAVRFERFNLLDDPSGLGRFDVIFCRNVLMYFNLEVRKKVLDNLAGRMSAGGTLYLGATETMNGLTDAFAPAGDGSGIFVRTPAPIERRLAG